jgi:hypothetical protein
VSFKIVGGKLAVDQDAFRVTTSLVKFQPAIRLIVRQAVAKIGEPYLSALAPGESDAELADPLTQSLRGDNAWPDYINAFENWSDANPNRLDLGTLFSSDFLFSELLQQTPDSGLILNEEEIDPASGIVTFSILPPFDSNTVRIELPAMLESRRRARIPQLRKRLARLNGSLWSSASVRKVFGPLYANLGLTPQVLVLPRNQTIQIVEGPRIASIVLPADQVPARDLDRLLWDLLDTGHFRIAMRSKNTWGPQRVLDFHRDLGYAEGDEPYAIQYQLQALQLLISPLGYTLTTQPSTRTGASQYVELRVQSASNAKTKKKSRHIAGGFEYKPGQGFSALGIAQLSSMSLSGGGPSGTLGLGGYSADFLDFERLQARVSASLNVSTSVERNRFLDGVKVNEQSTGEFATVEWQPWRELDGNTVALQLDPSHAVVLNQTLNTIQPAVQFVHNDYTSEYPSRTVIEPRVLIGLRFADCIVTANTHRSFDRWEYDLSGRFENAAGNPPIFELPSFGGADTVRGFRADDAIGRRLWSSQNELWHAIPGLNNLAPSNQQVQTILHSLKIATFVDVGGAYQTTGSYPGLRAGPGTGLRLDLRVAVLKFDWAYGFGQAATGGSRGKFYFTVALNTPH